MSITFSEDVNVKESDLSLSGVGATNFPYAHFFYDAITHVASWTLSTPLTKNSYQADLNGDGTNPVRDLDGNALDGEWSNNIDTYASGNGQAGGDFAFAFRVLPGDVNQNNGVENYDRGAVSTRQGATTASTNYSMFADVDGSGAIQPDDSEDVLSQLWATYPAGSPVGTTNDAPATADGQAITMDNDAVDVAISLDTQFHDAESPDSELAYQIVSNSNPSLFDGASINQASGSLILNSTANASGRSEIIVKATDSSGLSATATFVIDVNYINQAPYLNYTVEPEGDNLYHVYGTVSDDDDVEGLLVEFVGAFTVRASVYADGTFDFFVFAPAEGDVIACVSDFQGVSSNSMEWFVGVA